MSAITIDAAAQTRHRLRRCRLSTSAEAGGAADRHDDVEPLARREDRGGSQGEGLAPAVDQGVNHGHAIAPGIEVSLDALATRAARLMKVELIDPGTVIGKNTVQAMQAGAIYGFAGQVDGIVGHMRNELGAKAISVATGGLAPLIFDHAASLDVLDPLLTLRGLEIIHKRNHG